MSTQETTIYKGLPYCTLAIKYLNMVTSVAKKIVQNNNRNGQEWCDLELSIPLLFNFYHGLEVMMKGFSIRKENEKGNHKLTQLLAIVSAEHGNHPAFILMEKYIDINSADQPKRLYKFFLDTGTSPDDFYQSLKYPERYIGKNQTQYVNYLSLKYGSSAATDFYKELLEDAEEIKRLSGGLAKTLGLNDDSQNWYNTL